MEFTQRKKLRLDYDYSGNGYYFVTICTKGKQNLFGRMVGNGLDRSEIGRIAEEHLLRIPDHFPHVRVDKYIIMPNHIHVIFAFERDEEAERSRPFPTDAEDEWAERSRPFPTYAEDEWAERSRPFPTGAEDEWAERSRPFPTGAEEEQAERSRPFPTLSVIVGLYKSGVSRQAGKPVWQKSFYDHVIRGEQDYRFIWEYINNNPQKWELEEFYEILSRE